MTSQEKIRFGSLAGAVELRQDIAFRAAQCYATGVHLRNAIVVVATIFALMHVVSLLVPLPRAGWVGGNGMTVTMGLGAAWLLASAHVWYCRERFEMSQSELRQYEARGPSSRAVENQRPCRG